MMFAVFCGEDKANQKLVFTDPSEQHDFTHTLYPWQPFSDDEMEDFDESDDRGVKRKLEEVSLVT